MRFHRLHCRWVWAAGEQIRVVTQAPSQDVPASQLHTRKVPQIGADVTQPLRGAIDGIDEGGIVQAVQRAQQPFVASWLQCRQAAMRMSRD